MVLGLRLVFLSGHTHERRDYTPRPVPPARVLSLRAGKRGAPPRDSRRSAEFIRRSYELARGTRLEGRMASVIDHPQLRLRPGAVQIPGAAHRTDNVVATLDDDSRNSPDTRHIVQKLTIPAKEPFMEEVVAFNSRHGGRVARSAPLRDLVGIGAQMTRRGLPDRPSPCRANDSLLVRTCESPVIGANHAAPLGHRDGSDVCLPLVRVKGCRPLRVLVEPINLRATGKKDSPENQFGDAVRVLFRVRKGQR